VLNTLLWLSAGNNVSIIPNLRKLIRKENSPYPTSVEIVNGEIHISISGFPNHYTDTVQRILKILIKKAPLNYGMATLIDHDDQKGFTFEILNGEMHGPKEINLPPKP
jgi:hypothetical protein